MNWKFWNRAKESHLDFIKSIVKVGGLNKLAFERGWTMEVEKPEMPLILIERMIKAKTELELAHFSIENYLRVTGQITVPERGEAYK